MKNGEITVVGIPKTIDNDIYPVKRSLVYISYQC